MKETALLQTTRQGDEKGFRRCQLRVLDKDVRIQLRIADEDFPAELEDRVGEDVEIDRVSAKPDGLIEKCSAAKPMYHEARVFTGPDFDSVETREFVAFTDLKNG